MGDPTSSELAVPVSREDHVLGAPEAPLTLVEYGDYECPDCMASFPIVNRLIADLGERLRFVFRHFPQTAIHARASLAAQAAEAAGAQNKFWPMHNLLSRKSIELEGAVQDDKTRVLWDAPGAGASQRDFLYDPHPVTPADATPPAQPDPQQHRCKDHGHASQALRRRKLGSWRTRRSVPRRLG